MGRVPGASLVLKSLRRKAHYFRENTFISYAKPKVHGLGLSTHLGGRCRNSFAQQVAWRPGDSRVVTIRAWGKHLPSACPSTENICSLVFAKNVPMSPIFGESSSKMPADGAIFGKDERANG